MVINIKAFLTALALGICAASVCAQIATVESSTGLRARANSQAPLVPIAAGQTLAEGVQVVTDPSGVGVIRFSDGQKLALAENSEVRITYYRFEAEQPQSGSTVLDLLRGAMRSISGRIGARNPHGVRLNAATATIGIRGTDVIIALSEGTAHATVLSGEISFSTAGGSVNVGVGQIAIAVGTEVPVFTTLAALPATASGLITQLTTLQLAAAGIGAGAASAAAVGGISGVTLAAGAIAAGAIAASASSNNIDGTSGTGTGTTGTR